MPQRVTEKALEFNKGFILDMLGGQKSNERHLALARRALADILQHDLTERQHEMIQLYYYEGMNTRKIAQALGVNKSTVSRTLERARERIRKHLRFYFDYTDFCLEEE